VPEVLGAGLQMGPVLETPEVESQTAPVEPLSEIQDPQLIGL